MEERKWDGFTYLRAVGTACSATACAACSGGEQLQDDGGWGTEQQGAVESWQRGGHSDSQNLITLHGALHGDRESGFPCAPAVKGAAGKAASSVYSGHAALAVADVAGRRRSQGCCHPGLHEKLIPRAGCSEGSSTGGCERDLGKRTDGVGVGCQAGVGRHLRGAGQAG